MREFAIRLSTVEDVRNFVCVATVQPFEVFVGTERQTVSAKSFMGIFSLNLRETLRVCMECSEEEFMAFRGEASPFLAT